MSVEQLNPNHPTSVAMDGQWAKMACLLLRKFQASEVVITMADLEAAAVEGAANCIGVRELPDGLHVYLVTEAEGRALAEQNGGALA